MMKSSRAKILHVHTLPIISGSGINTFLSMNGLKHKYEMSMACAPGGKLNDLVRENCMRVHTIRNFVSEMNPLKDIHALWQLYCLIRREKHVLIHTHNSKGGFIGRLAARLAGSVPVVHTVHGFAFHENEPFLRRNLFLFLEKLGANWCTRTICISQPLVDLWLSHNMASRRTIRKIYSGIDTKAFDVSETDRMDTRTALGLQPHQIAVGQVSKLWEGKGHSDIIRAMPIILKTLPGLKMFFIGDGPIRRKLEDLTRETGVADNVVFLGHRDDVAQVTASLDIAVLASHFEGMGRVVLEAMAAGVPVIAARVGGIVDLIEDKSNGLLIDPHSPDQIAQAIIRLAKNETQRWHLGEAGKKSLKKDFDADTMVKEIDKVYEEILGEQGNF